MISEHMSQFETDDPRIRSSNDQSHAMNSPRFLAMRTHIPGALHRLERAVPPVVRRFARGAFPGLIERLHNGVLGVAPYEPAEATIASGPLRGRRFNCRLRYEADYVFGNHEPAVAEWLMTHLRAGDTMFDVGAHAGYTALIAAQRVGPAGHVVAFEPNPSNRELILRNLASNPDVAASIVLEPVAVSDSCGVAFLAGTNATGRLTDHGDPVSTVSMDAYVARTQRRPALIKFDIEGGETKAFKGMCKLLCDVRPILIVEIHDAMAQHRFAELVAQYDYRVWAEGSPHPEPVPIEWTSRRSYLAVPIDTTHVCDAHRG